MSKIGDNIWTSFCPRKPDIEHAAEFGHDLACSYCGKANPKSPVDEPSVIILDSPPAQKSDNSQGQFTILSTESNTACQQSIAHMKHITCECPHAGAAALSTHPKSESKGLGNLTAKKHQIQINTYTDELEDQDLELYKA